MAPSAPNDRYCQADFFAQLFQKSRFFLGPGNGALIPLVLVIFGTLFGTPKKSVSKIAYEADANFRHRFEAFYRTHRHQTDKQTRTSYLGTGVAD